MPKHRPESRVLLILLAGLLACTTLSVQEEKKLGTQAQREVREHFDLVRDRIVVNYVREIGAKLVEAARPSPFTFRFYVVEDEAINAFALPAGALYVNTGTIQKAKDVSELAGVMAHEIGHVTARHVAQLYRRQRNTGLAAQIVPLIIGILTGSSIAANAAGLGSSVAATAYLSTYSREAETEADRLAVETLVPAGYDPNGMVTFFDTLKQEAEGGLRMPQMLSSHPATDERIDAVASEVRRREPLPPVRRDDSGKLQIIQRRIDLILGTDPIEEP